MCLMTFCYSKKGCGIPSNFKVLFVSFSLLFLSEGPMGDLSRAVLL